MKLPIIVLLVKLGFYYHKNYLLAYKVFYKN